LKSYFIKNAAFWEIKNRKIKGDQNLDDVFLQVSGMELYNINLQEGLIATLCIEIIKNNKNLT
jgi:hypothetical protein